MSATGLFGPPILKTVTITTVKTETGVPALQLAEPRPEDTDEVRVARPRGTTRMQDAMAALAHAGAGMPGTTASMSALDEALAWLRLTPLSRLPAAATRRFTEQLPKIDLHRHLGGSIPIERLLETAKEHGVTLPAGDVEGLRPHVQITEHDKTLHDYLRKFDVIGQVLKSPATIEALAASCIEDARRDGLAHVELRFAPQYMARPHGLRLEDVIEAIARGVKRGVSDTGVTARLIVIITRHDGVDEGARVARLAAKHQHLGVVGLDLAGDETRYPPGPFADVFKTAKKAGLCVTIHAGEAGSADNVLASVVGLQADRIGHGVAARDDAQVIDTLRLLGVPVEGCLTANQQVGAVREGEQHPGGVFLRHGIRQVLNTDNPSISGITLSQEFQRAIKEFELTLAEVEQLIDNSIDGAFLTSLERARLGKVVDRRLANAEAELVGSLGRAELLGVLENTMEAKGLSPLARGAVLERIGRGLS